MLVGYAAAGQREDVNGDGVVNVQDLVLVASNFGKRELDALRQYLPLRLLLVNLYLSLH